MTFDYNKEDKTPMSLVLENGITAEGEFIDLRITVDTLPKGKQWYQIRHCDDDGSEPASLKRGCVAVNFLRIDSAVEIFFYISNNFIHLLRAGSGATE